MRRVAIRLLRSARLLIIGLAFAVSTGVPAFYVAGSDAAAPPPEQWITINKDYSSQRYVDLDQITPANVGGLKEVCELQLNEPSSFNSGMLMVGRTIYVDTLRATYAVDAATCDLRWRNDIDFKLVPRTNSNRGPAYLDGKIFRGTGDGRVIALDAENGKLVWQTQGADPTRSETFIAAPVAWDGKVFIGIGISDFGIRGRMAAFDAKTGKELWRFNTIPIGIEPGAETWHNSPFVPPAGGGFWTGFSLDPATGEVFAPVANPFPDFTQAARSGDNLYTNSVISLNTATGALNWYHQAISADDHDWDLGTPPTLYRTPGGRDMLAIVGKEGFVIGLDRTTRSVVFKTAGTTTENTGKVDETLKLVCPGSVGGAQWNGAAYHPGLNILYTGQVDWCFYYSTKIYGADPGYWEPGEKTTVRPDFSKRPSGWVTAIDGETGNVLWKFHTEGQMLAGLVPTKTGLLVAGDVRGNLLVFDAKSGVVLKRLDAHGALNHGLISYAVDGNQYVAAAVGGLTLNANGVSGPLRVSVYGLHGSDAPKIVKLDRRPLSPVPVTGALANDDAAFGFFCGSCHGRKGEGYVAPPLLRQTQMGDVENLKAFLKSVPPPMPIMYPGLLEDQDVQQIAAYLKVITSRAADAPPPSHTLASEDPSQPVAADEAAASERPGPENTAPSTPGTRGSEHWQAVYSVLTSPRCINCHTGTNYPRQGDDRHPHIFSVVRGADDHGAPVARCSACHGAENNPNTGIPGRSDWHAAPLSMAWETAPGVAMTEAKLCAVLKDRLRNGNRSLADLAEHVDTEHLVLWAWDPGVRWNGEARRTPPISHDVFVAAFKEWVDDGAACPSK
jgi:PQQ-dependent dehydrogenase (methanol/ethanol family)